MTSLACALFLSCDRMSRRTPSAEAPEDGAPLDGGTDDA
jgi:hypothetical protein